MGVCAWGWIAVMAVSFMLLLVIQADALVPFLGVFVLQFLISWTLQIGGLYIKFRAGWRRDTQMMDKLRKHELYMMDDDDNGDAAHSSALVRFTKILKRKRKFKCPYYVTFEDSNRYIM